MVRGQQVIIGCGWSVLVSMNGIVLVGCSQAKMEGIRISNCKYSGIYARSSTFEVKGKSLIQGCDENGIYLRDKSQGTYQKEVVVVRDNAKGNDVEIGSRWDAI
eukprot:TRINITY_DN2042_c0_g1_i7.p2 TRINITY_DN2042_c0_g1~~TRINITY_DN2042_c0_g1_i7.p2  ORF type:complete len:104 (+),score=9.50 TRINITY_DN2042_c0_g1_i7:13-324(+)